MAKYYPQKLLSVISVACHVTERTYRSAFNRPVIYLHSWAKVFGEDRAINRIIPLSCHQEMMHFPVTLSDVQSGGKVFVEDIAVTHVTSPREETHFPSAICRSCTFTAKSS